MRPLRIFTWHIHGSYLYSLVQSHHEFYLPIKPGKPEGYGGRLKGFPWPDTVKEVPIEAIPELELDCILFQSAKNYTHDQYEILSEAQRRLPRIYLEHDPPRQHPTDTSHPVDDPDILLVHVTAFNQLMWDNHRTPTQVIEHGVMIPDSIRYSGELDRGLVVVNGLKARGRRLGCDVFEQVRSQVPLDLIGMQSEQLGGLGEVPHSELPGFEARYRFFLNPIRYTSLPLSLCEAMMVGLPIVGLATTELVSVVENGVTGYVDTNPENLVEFMRELLQAPYLAQRLSAQARRVARQRFGIQRFIRDWDRVLAQVTLQPVRSPVLTASPAISGGFQ